MEPGTSQTPSPQLIVNVTVRQQPILLKIWEIFGSASETKLSGDIGNTPNHPLGLISRFGRVFMNLASLPPPLQNQLKSCTLPCQLGGPGTLLHESTTRPCRTVVTMPAGTLSGVFILHEVCVGLSFLVFHIFLCLISPSTSQAFGWQST